MRKLSFYQVSGWLLFIAISTGMSSCMLGPKYEKVEVAHKNYFRFDTLKVDSTTVIDWWMLFDDPVLDTLVKTALNENQDVRQAASRVMQARAVVGFHNADFGPKIDVQGVYNTGNFNQFNGPTGSEQDIFLGAGALSYELDVWGKYRRLSQSAREELLASQYGMRAIQIELITSVIENYFLLLDYRERYRVSVNTLQLREDYLDIINARFDKGIIPQIDVNQAEIQYAIALASVPQYRRLIANAENALSILIGRAPDGIIVGKELMEQVTPPAIPSGLPSTLVDRRPDVAEAEHKLIAQNAQIGVAQAERFPSFGLTGILGGISTDLTNVSAGSLVWSAGGSLVGPLFYWNKNLRKVDVEKEKTVQAKLEYEKTVLNAFREVEDALMSIETYRDELKATKLQVDAAVNARNLSQNRYDQGVTSYLEVLESQRQSFEAELRYAQKKNEYLTSYVLLYKALGGGWISEQEKKAAEEKAKAEEEQKEQEVYYDENPNDMENIPYRGFRK
jgi:multidrug efflux system outer membrane protein